VQAHDARITVTSDPGKGTEFELRFRKTARPNPLPAEFTERRDIRAKAQGQ
jgi:hypothetical protein